MKRAISIILAMLICFNLMACGKNDTGDTSVIYELNMSGTGLVTVPYEFVSGGTQAKAEDVLKKLCKSSGDGGYVRAIPKDVEVRSVSVNDVELTVDFSAAYSEIESYMEPLVRAAVVLSLCEIPGVESVVVTVEGNTLADTGGNVISGENTYTYITDFSDRDRPNQHAVLTLYYASKEGEGLIMEEREVDYNSNPPLGRVVLSELSKSPKTEGAISPIGNDFSISSYAVSDGIVYMTLGQGYLNQSLEVPDNIKIYAIVNSLTELSYINRVQISVEGEITGSKPQLEKYTGLFEKNLDLVLNREEEEE